LLFSLAAYLYKRIPLFSAQLLFIIHAYVIISTCRTQCCWKLIVF